MHQFLLCGCVLALTAVLSVANSGQAAGEEPVFPRHEPYGKGIGAVPGRVVWARDPSAVNWNGDGYWWEVSHFDQSAVQKMTRLAIAALSNQPDAKAGWKALFTLHNSAREGKNGYRRGGKIAIKANMNGAGTFGDDRLGHTQLSFVSPVQLRALLISLVEDAGVEPGDITVCDPSRVFPDEMIAYCTKGSLKEVQFQDRIRDGNRASEPDLKTPVVWSQPFDGEQNYLPTCFIRAKYLISLASLKGHSYGITLSGKNHFGSLINSSRMRPPEAAGIHRFLTSNRMGHYTVLVDLLANAELGQKTVLFMLDALICAPTEGTELAPRNCRWQSAPFNGGYTANLFVSQDPLALDSVGADFLINEPTVLQWNGSLRGNKNVENYLHEAGLVANPPSGTVYRNGQGQRVTNIGVHEHWNNAADKQYSRNLGKSEGIELIRVGKN